MAPGDPKRVRLRDVAAQAGVSVGSASQAFGRPELVSEEVRERVLAAARTLGYSGPDPAARRLRLGQAGALGVIFSERLRYQFTDPASPCSSAVSPRASRGRRSACCSSRTPASATRRRRRCAGCSRRLRHLLGGAERSARGGGARPSRTGRHRRPAPRPPRRSSGSTTGRRHERPRSTCASSGTSTSGCSRSLPHWMPKAGSGSS